jgi:hypothetical protein
MDDSEMEGDTESAVVCEVSTCRIVLADLRWCRTLGEVLEAKR